MTPKISTTILTLCSLVICILDDGYVPDHFVEVAREDLFNGGRVSFIGGNLTLFGRSYESANVSIEYATIVGVGGRVPGGGCKGAKECSAFYTMLLAPLPPLPLPLASLKFLDPLLNYINLLKSQTSHFFKKQNKPHA